MPKFKWNRALTTAAYGEVAAGDVIDVSDEAAARYTVAGWGTIQKPAPKKVTARGDDR